LSKKFEIFSEKAYNKRYYKTRIEHKFANNEFVAMGRLGEKSD
jgi:hypothetical protein